MKKDEQIDLVTSTFFLAPSMQAFSKYLLHACTVPSTGWEPAHSITTIYSAQAVFLPAQRLIGWHCDFPFANHLSLTCCSSGSTLAKPPPRPHQPPTLFTIFIPLATEIVSGMGSWSRLPPYKSALRLSLELLRENCCFSTENDQGQMEPWTC